ncbi:Surfeit locus protein 4 [Neolecta irregularis DAH-3]|uniref:Surfeit locus protein 4 n=1 Tax=Neolecta irregularis (strain DAH-3) TaxID=1198029 RepID=A0A1U7LP18_NEOID|nr:Surfeit locus protein 4 [Neolecta irregularis DAH-3]|eukprot:OLL24394.1 Surfeit locus protein 4 [Neolecta irregularis DAH-3]
MCNQCFVFRQSGYNLSVAVTQHHLLSPPIISFNMAQYHNVRPTYGGNAYQPQSGSGFGESSDIISQVRAQTSKIEDILDTISEPIKPYLPGIGRFLIVVTFLEDALRILTQWSDQVHYLQRFRGMWWGVTHMFLLLNVTAMFAGSVLVVIRKHSEVAVGALLGVVVSQAFGYGLLFNLSFFLRNLSVIGGLLMVLSDSLSQRKALFAGLPSLSETDRKKYFQLAGRVLLIFLFMGFILEGQWSILRVIISVIGLVACVMVAVGFKAKFSATVLVMMLSVFNVLINNFWSVNTTHHTRDFLKYITTKIITEPRYDFFQTLSIVGGLLMLVNMGPGGISVDEKKKVY